MSDPFAIANSILFSTSIAVSGILTDSNSNQLTVRCVVQNSLSLIQQGYASSILENKTIIMIPKSIDGSSFRDDIISIEIDGTIYLVDGVLQEDQYTISFICKGV